MRALALAGGVLPAQSADPPPVYELHLVAIFETPETEFVLVIGNSGFKTVAGLKDFLASRPRGTTLKRSPCCVRIGEPLLSSDADLEDFKAFCADHGIDFILVRRVSTIGGTRRKRACASGAELSRGSVSPSPPPP